MLFLYNCYAIFFLNLKYRAPYLLLLKFVWNNILTQNGQIQEKMLKYYINKIKRNRVCNTEWPHKPGFIIGQVSLGFDVRKVELGQVFLPVLWFSMFGIIRSVNTHFSSVSNSIQFLQLPAPINTTLFQQCRLAIFLYTMWGLMGGVH